jgi:hypothetical protein
LELEAKKDFVVVAKVLFICESDFCNPTLSIFVSKLCDFLLTAFSNFEMPQNGALVFFSLLSGWLSEEFLQFKSKSEPNGDSHDEAKGKGF